MIQRVGGQRGVVEVDAGIAIDLEVCQAEGLHPLLVREPGGRVKRDDQSSWNPYTSRYRKIAASSPATGNTITNTVALAWPIAEKSEGNKKMPRNTDALLKT